MLRRGPYANEINYSRQAETSQANPTTCCPPELYHDHARSPIARTRRTRWSDNAANAIWDSSIVKIVLGGASNSRDPQDLSSLIGDRDETTEPTTIGDRGFTLVSALDPSRRDHGA